MPSLRYPILLWEDHQGHWTARLAEYAFFPAALDVSAQKALAQLKEAILLHARLYNWSELLEPEFLDPRLGVFKIRVQPYYKGLKDDNDNSDKHGGKGSSGNLKLRRLPVGEQIVVRTHCVLGKEEGGLAACAIPMYQAYFNYYDPKALEKLVRQCVCDKLQGFTSGQIARYLSPKEVLLEEVVISSTALNRSQKTDRSQPDTPVLKAGAAPVGSSALRKQYSRAFERESEIARLADQLNQEKSNILLVGEPGSGKTTVLVNAVRRIERMHAESAERQLLFWQTTANRIVAGMKHLGEWQERCEKMIDELSMIDGVLCLESLGEALRVGGGGEPGDSVAAFFMSYIQHGDMRMVCEATPAEVDACRQRLPGFLDFFRTLEIATLDRIKAVSVLRKTCESDAKIRETPFEDGVPPYVYHLFSRFSPYCAFPGPAVQFARRLWEQAGNKETVNMLHVAKAFMNETGLPELFLRDDVILDADDVLEWFRRRILGQEEACQAACELATLFKAGLNDPGRPVSVFFFCGPTGVGKTAMAKAISGYFFGHGKEQDRLIRLDMSEYATPGAADRLIEQPDGKASDFIAQIRDNPFSVVLFDEIEKADPQVFDMLLNVLDEGRLTDKNGRLTTFRSSVIIMTSNVGAKSRAPISFDGNDSASSEADVMSFFRPEFYNRIDRVVQFNSLEHGTILEITRKELAELAGREGIVKRGIKLVWGDALVEFLAREGFDRRFGARPLQRKIEERVVTPLARYLTENAKLRDAELTMDFDGEVVAILPHKA